VYTNVAGVDPDIGIYKCTKNPPVPEYRAPYIIVPAWIQCWMYVFSTFQMQLDDWFSFFRGSMENIKINDTGKGKTAYVIFTKVMFYLHRIILPMVLGFGIIETLLNLAVWYAVSGMLFGYFSQITHISDEREWPIDDPRGWGELQVLTSCDYAQDSYFWTYLSGYLNYQVTHHLFPSVNPRHYVKLLPMVIETCKEYNIQYTEYKTFWEAAARHLNHLEQFKTDENSDSIFTLLGRALGIGPRTAQTIPLSESYSSVVNQESGSVH
jgi:fatty acid desaturase